jgi:peptide/nickel transport system ATP-binding protein
VGRLVEVAQTRELYTRPLHPYTEALLSAVPNPDPDRRSQRIILEGEVADPAHPPSGCYFHPRCRYAQDVCKTELPPLRTLTDGRQAACHFAGELSLNGIRV